MPPDTSLYTIIITHKLPLNNCLRSCQIKILVCVVNHSKINVSVYNDGHSQVCSSKKLAKTMVLWKFTNCIVCLERYIKTDYFCTKRLNPKIHKEIINPTQARPVFIGFESYLNCNVVFALKNYTEDKYTVHWEVVVYVCTVDGE